MILSPRSARIVEARKLLQRKHRAATGLFLVEGPQAVGEAIASGTATGILCLPERAGAYLECGVPVHETDQAALASLCETVNPQGVVAICRWSQPTLHELLGGELLRSQDASTALVSVLHEVADPGNLGTVIRVSDAAGAAAVITSAGSVDPANGKCVRASTGSVFHLPVVAGGVTRDVLAELKGRGFQILAADVTADSIDLFEAEDRGLLSAPTAWLFGNEAHGLPVDLLQQSDHVVRIPILGRAESLNLATAAAVALYSSARARRGSR